MWRGAATALPGRALPLRGRARRDPRAVRRPGAGSRGLARLRGRRSRSACPSGARPGKRLELQTAPRMRREASGTTRWPKPRERAPERRDRPRQVQDGERGMLDRVERGRGLGRERPDEVGGIGRRRRENDLVGLDLGARVADREAAGGRTDPVDGRSGAERASEGPGHRPGQGREPLAKREEAAHPGAACVSSRVGSLARRGWRPEGRCRLRAPSGSAPERRREPTGGSRRLRRSPRRTAPRPAPRLRARAAG